MKTADKFNLKIKSLWEIFKVSLKLGLTSFGGPIAHIGYFHNEYVQKKKWMDEQSYADLVVLCQFLPGPASSQLGISIGTIRAGLAGGFIAWFGFTAPSAVFLITFAFLLHGFNLGDSHWLHGLKIVAVVVVAQAVLIMWKKLITDWKLAVIAIAATSLLLYRQTSFIQIIIIVSAGITGLLMYRKKITPEISHIEIPISRKTAAALLIIFFSLLLLLPVVRQITGNHWISMADSFYRSGSLVFGGGHVVLPLLEEEVVPVGWITKENFLAGYGAAQAVPGPLFTFASYLGTMISGIGGAVLAIFAIFLPAFLLVIGTLPFWTILRRNSKIKGALTGINAAVVGILLAALYNPLWTSAIFSLTDAGLAAVLFAILMIWKVPSWVIVAAGAAGSTVIGIL